MKIEVVGKPFDCGMEHAAHRYLLQGSDGKMYVKLHGCELILCLNDWTVVPERDVILRVRILPPSEEVRLRND